MEKVEFLILRNLLHNEEYLRKVVPFLKSEYFEDEKQKIVYQEIASFVEEYNELTTKEVLCIEIEKRKDITDSMFKDITFLIDELDNSPADLQWLLDTTEKWCRDRAIYLALIESISLADGKDDTKGRDAIPSILSDALAVSFDNHVGHDYLIDYEERYESYHRKEDKIPFDLEFFDKVTKGGLPNKTLNIALAGTGVGKSLFMCHFASSVLLQGKNVLYITMEMAEERIAERIDANLMDLPIQQLETLPKNVFNSKIEKIAKGSIGKLIVKGFKDKSLRFGTNASGLPQNLLDKVFVGGGKVVIDSLGYLHRDQDGDGVRDTEDQCPNTPPGEQVDANGPNAGCSDSQKDSDGDGVSDDKDKCPGTPAGEIVDADGCPIPLFVEKLTFVENIYPNPAKDHLKVILKDNSKVKDIHFVGLSGKISKPRNFNQYNRTLNINISNLNDGIYLMNVNTEKGSNRVKIVIKK